MKSSLRVFVVVASGLVLLPDSPALARGGPGGSPPSPAKEAARLDAVLVRLTPDQRRVVLEMIEAGMVTAAEVIATGGDPTALRRLLQEAWRRRQHEDAVATAREAGYLTPDQAARARGDASFLQDLLQIVANGQVFGLNEQSIRDIQRRYAERGGEAGRALADRLVVTAGVKENWDIDLPPNAFDATKNPAELVGMIADLQNVGLDERVVKAALSNPALYDRLKAVGYEQAVVALVFAADPRNPIFDDKNGLWKKVGDRFERVSSRDRASRDRLRDLATGGPTARPSGSSGKSQPKPGQIPGFGGHTGSGGSSGGGSSGGANSSSGGGSSSGTSSDRSGISVRTPGGRQAFGDVFDRGGTGGHLGLSSYPASGSGGSGSGGGRGSGQGSGSGKRGGGTSGSGGGAQGGGSSGSSGGGGSASGGSGGGASTGGSGSGTGGGTGGGTGSGGSGGSGGGSGGGTGTGTSGGTGSGGSGGGATSGGSGGGGAANPSPHGGRRYLYSDVEANADGTKTVVSYFSDQSWSATTFDATSGKVVGRQASGTPCKLDTSGDVTVVYVPPGTDPRSVETSSDPDEYRSARVAALIAQAMAEIQRVTMQSREARKGARTDPVRGDDAIPYTRPTGAVPVRRLRGLLVGNDGRGRDDGDSGWRPATMPPPSSRDKGDVDPADDDQR